MRKDAEGRRALEVAEGCGRIAECAGVCGGCGGCGLCGTVLQIPGGCGRVRSVRESAGRWVIDGAGGGRGFLSVSYGP
jgi:hypothetical protein